jgi:Ca2+-binding RTX toxin-like protein
MPTTYGTYQPKVSQDFLNKVAGIGQRLNLVPEYLIAVMGFETGGTYSPSIRNAAGSGATGLIQFMPSTAKSLGTTTDALAKMTAIQQLDYVEKYFKPYANRLISLEDTYMAVLYPAAIGKGASHNLFTKGTTAYSQNSGLDLNKDGFVKVGEATAKVQAFLPTSNLFKPISSPTNGNDLLKGGSGNDNINALAGDDTISGGSGNDSLQGNTGNDKLYGEDGFDTLLGGPGNDNLNGGGGNDRLDAFYNTRTGEVDTLTGGAGADTFVIGGRFGGAGFNGYLGNSWAILADFKPSEGDKIQVFGKKSDLTYQVGNQVGYNATDTAVRWQGDVLFVAQNVSISALDKLSNFTFIA